MRYPLLLSLLALSACQPAAGPAPDAPMPAVGSALYRVTFEATWSAGTHADFPAGAHFSPLVGLAHRADGLIFQAGQLASPGIRDMAELGKNTALRTEIAALRASEAAASLLDGQATALSPGMLTDTIRLDAAHPLLTVVTMIAPSPDWFAALRGENLLANGQWVAQRTVPARAYDAGTDSGPAFTSPDQPTRPAEPVAALRLPPAGGPATAEGPPVGQWHLDRIK